MSKGMVVHTPPPPTFLTTIICSVQQAVQISSSYNSVLDPHAILYFLLLMYKHESITCNRNSYCKKCSLISWKWVKVGLVIKFKACSNEYLFKKETN